MLRHEVTVSVIKVLAMFGVGCLVVILLSVTVRDGPIRLSLGPQLTWRAIVIS